MTNFVSNCGAVEFDERASFGAEYMLSIARRATAKTVKLAYHKSGLPYLYELYCHVVAGIDDGQDLINEAVYSIMEYVNAHAVYDFHSCYIEGFRAAKSAVNRAIYHARRRVSETDIQKLADTAKDVEDLYKGDDDIVTYDIMQTIVYALQGKRANIALYIDVLRGLLEGMTAGEIAEVRHVSERRVRAIRESLRQLLIDGGYTEETMMKRA